MTPFGPPTHRTRRRWHRSFAVCAAVACAIPALVLATQQLRYEREYPAIGYSTRSPTDTVARLQQRIDSDEAQLQFDAKGGYLASLLRELEIDVASQLLVFSKTSFQTGLISPGAPRAIYFKDDVYVAWVQRSPDIEISAVDPRLGAVFYTLPQEDSRPPRFERKTFLCLRCHDSYSLTGGGVPRHLMGSGVPDANGRTAFHEGWHVTSDQTPIVRRWGGWYVTGTHGQQRHLGNLFVSDPSATTQLDLDAGANVTDLGALVDTAPYLGGHSDVVALMVMEHQITVQNLITRVGYDARTAIHGELGEQARGDTADVPSLSDATRERVGTLAEPLVKALLFVDAAPLTSPIEGTSDFAKTFERLGPSDAQGRSLRQLDLATRLFRYPCSHLIYSESFDGLPDSVKDYVYRRLWDVLAGQDATEDFTHLSDADRTATLDILKATKADFAAARAD